MTERGTRRDGRPAHQAHHVTRLAHRRRATRGRPRDDLEPGSRMVPHEKSAVIAYRAAAAVEITNISYGGRDYEALYRGHESGLDES